MIQLDKPLSEEKLLEISNDLERLKKLPANYNRVSQIKAIERILEANKKFVQRPVDAQPTPIL